MTNLATATLLYSLDKDILQVKLKHRKFLNNHLSPLEARPSQCILQIQKAIWYMEMDYSSALEWELLVRMPLR